MAKCVTHVRSSLNANAKAMEEDFWFFWGSCISRPTRREFKCSHKTMGIYAAVGVEPLVLDYWRIFEILPCPAEPD